MEKDSIEITVRGYHVDQYHHVNNARYLEFLEEARWDHYDRHFEVGDFDHSEKAFVIVNINISYHYPASVGDVLRIETGLKKIGNKSITLNQTITLTRNNTLVADADVTLVVMDLQTQKAIPIEGKLRDILEHTF